MSLKARVASFIRENPKATYEQWLEFQKITPEVRLRKGPKGTTLINLNGKSGFSDPESWLHNYEAGQKINWSRATEQLRAALPQEEFFKVFSSELELTSSQNMSDYEFWHKFSEDMMLGMYEWYYQALHSNVISDSQRNFMLKSINEVFFKHCTLSDRYHSWWELLVDHFNSSEA